MVMDVTPLLLKAELPIAVSPFPKVTVARRRHSLNAYSPMTFTLSGIVTLLMSSLPLKASLPIFDTVDGIITSTAVPLYLVSVPFSMINPSETDANDVTSVFAFIVDSAITPVAGIIPNVIAKLRAATFLKFSLSFMTMPPQMLLCIAQRYCECAKKCADHKCYITSALTL